MTAAVDGGRRCRNDSLAKFCFAGWAKLSNVIGNVPAMKETFFWSGSRYRLFLNARTACWLTPRPHSSPGEAWEVLLLHFWRAPHLSCSAPVAFCFSISPGRTIATWRNEAANCSHLPNLIDEPCAATACSVTLTPRQNGYRLQKKGTAFGPVVINQAFPIVGWLFAVFGPYH